ncbi:glutamate racemase [Ramlibacter sp. MAHUQ-53]|uniref:glutamate racemase n=1 Tax=unclassified Ramlibacter TaxID=2617605 RepID=UPI00363C56CA
MSAPLGVFDSGIGGLSVLRALRRELPHEDVVYFADTAWVPYGERGDAFVQERTLAVAQDLIEQRGVKLLVVACNTATASAIAAVRARWPQVPVVGVEPALKPAARATRTGRVGVLATRGTLASAKFRMLHESLAAQAEFVLQPCDGLAAAIEADDAPRIESLCAQYIGALGPLGPAAGCIDTLVLGCTHYPFALPVIERLAGPGVAILETGEPVARQARRLLEQAGLLAPGPQRGRLTLACSGPPPALEAAARRWLGD